MTIVPPYISDECKSNAEKKVFKSFENINIASKSYLFHSVNLPEHQYKQWGEIDFLLISTNGIMAFEVKGGRISRKNGVWTYTDRYGKDHRTTEGPNNQAKSAAFSLKKRLEKALPKINFNKITFGWAMIFPDIDYASKDLELPFEMVCDYDSMGEKKFEAFVNNVYKYFKEKKDNLRELSIDQIQSISNYVRPDIDLVPKLKTSLDAANLSLLRGTKEQYMVLSSVLDNERILCSGGGGTGKTLLAIEIAKRSPNKKILVICKNRILAKFIKGQIQNELVDVLSILEMEGFQYAINKTINKEGQSMMTNFIPKGESLYDMLIVDEGQDLLSYIFLEYMGGMLKNNLDNGSWVWFMDLNNQSNVDGNITIFDSPKPLAEELLEDTNEEYKLSYELLLSFNPVKLNLTHNCRNTEQIIHDTQLYTGADIGIAKIKGIGSYPIYQKISSQEESGLKLEEALEKWSSEINQLNDIVILSTVEYAQSSAAYLSQKWQDKIQILTKENVLNQNRNKILFSTITDYKGLDKLIVAITDLEKTTEFLPADYQNNPHYIYKSIESFLYVGMTRSNSILWISVSEKFGNFLKKQQKINSQKMSIS